MLVLDGKAQGSLVAVGAGGSSKMDKIANTSSLQGSTLKDALNYVDSELQAVGAGGVTLKPWTPVIDSYNKLDETAYPANATSNIFEITGTPTPLQWDALGGTVVNGDLVAFNSAGVPFVVVVDVTSIEGAVQQAENAAERAEAARDASVVNAQTYENIGLGLAAVANGQTFDVEGSDDTAVQRYRRVSETEFNGPIASFPSTLAVRQIALDVRETRMPLAEYLGAEDIVPLYTDTDGRILIGINRQNQTVYAAGLGEGVMGQYGSAVYEGSGPIYPIVTDESLKVLLGVNSETGELVGLVGSSDTGNVVNNPKRLAEPIVPAEINHILFYGQSLSVGAAAGSVISQTQPYANITFSGGPRAWNGTTWDFSSFKPLVEDAVSPAPDGSSNRAETSCSGAANFASTLLAQNGVMPSEHIILASTAGRGGYRIDQLQKGASWYQNFLGHVDGAQALNTDHAVHAICWVQGENDVGPTNYATYRARLEQLQIDTEADIQQRTNQTHPVYFLTYQLSWGTLTSPDISAAHLNLAQKSDRFFLTTPTYHLPHASDNIHLTAIGYKWMGAYFGRSYASLVAGNEPKWLNPISATLRENVIRVRFDVPNMPLVLDNIGLAYTTDSGFKITAGGNNVPIVNISVDGSDVVITLVSTPSGGVTVRYGLDYTGAGLTIGDAGSGNLRDSAPETTTIQGQAYPLWNVCPAFSIPVTILGE